VALERKVPYIVSIHGGVHDVPAEEARSWTAPTRGKFEWGKLLGWWVGSRRVLDDASAVLCLGDKEYQTTRELFPNKRVEFFPNGVDYKRFSRGESEVFRKKHGIPPEATVLLTVARIDAQKNQKFAIEALRSILKHEPKAHLVLIGPITDQTYYRQVVDLIGECKLEEKVTILPGLAPNSRELEDAYHGADLFLLPSIHEPFGIVILEAWSAGLPVVASRVGGIPSFVVDDSDGLLYESNNLECCTNQIRRIIQQPRFARNLANSGKRKAQEQYSWEQLAARLVTIYEAVVNEYPVRQ
jgi:glycosyltransferase involved in cell wall biosynthesis